MKEETGWSVVMTAQIGERVAALRKSCGMSVQGLADRCTELGVPLGRIALAKLEGGQRQAVTPAELSAFAAVLGVAPIELIYPIGYADQVEILPGRAVAPLDAARWFGGELMLRTSAERTQLHAAAAGELGVVALLREHDDYVQKVLAADSNAAATRSRAEETGDPEAAREAAFRLSVSTEWHGIAGTNLRWIRARMRERGMTLPALPAVLSDIDGADT